MGGKVWSDKEEQVFWEVIIPQSAIAADPNDQELSWESCGKVMQRTMGDEARRTYTGSMLCKLMFCACQPSLTLSQMNIITRISNLALGQRRRSTLTSM